MLNAKLPAGPAGIQFRPKRHDASHARQFAKLVARARARSLGSVKRTTFSVGLAEWVDSAFEARTGENLADGHKLAVKQRYDAHEQIAGRIAQSLHDDASQMLAVVYLELANISRDCPQSTTLRIDAVAKHLDGVCEHIRQLSHELHPAVLERFGLMPALRSLAEGVKKRFGVAATVSGDLALLSPEVEITLYRVVQEALNNVVHHAAASCVDIRLWADDRGTHCTVSDNGVGMQLDDSDRDQSGGLGLLGIQQRVQSLGGTCTLVSRQYEGLKLVVEIPDEC